MKIITSHCDNCSICTNTCQVMRNALRLFGGECSLVGRTLRQQPQKPEPYFNLGLWPGAARQEQLSGSADEVVMKNEKSPAADPGRNDETIGQAIDKLRKEKGLSIKAFGQAVGISFCSVYNWVHERSKPTLQSVQTLDDFFGSDLAARFGEQLRKAPIGRSTPRADDAAEQAAPQAPEKVDVAECSIPAGPAAAEQKIAAAFEQGRDWQPDEQALRVITNVADKLMLLAGGLLQAVKTIREGRK